MDRNQYNTRGGQISMNKKQRNFAERLQNHHQKKAIRSQYEFGGNSFNTKTFKSPRHDRRLEVHYQSEIPEQANNIVSNGIFF